MKNFSAKFKTMFNNVTTEIESQKTILEKKALIKKEEKEILDIYQVIGEKVFEVYKSGADVGEAFHEDCKVILEKLEKINNLQQELEQVKLEKEETIKMNTMKLEEESNNQVIVEGEIIETKVIAKENENDEEQIAEENSVETDNQNNEVDNSKQKIEEEESTFCTNCGNKVSEESKFCNKCGNKVRD